MVKRSKFLPERVSEAIKVVLKLIVGAIVVVLGIWALVALIFYNPYLDGFAVASSFGGQTIMGQVVGFLRYGIGFVSAMFLILCVIRVGLSWLLNFGENLPVVYNALRIFIATCFGAAGFGLMKPVFVFIARMLSYIGISRAYSAASNAAFGGLLGVIASSDIFYLIGKWGILVGVLLLVGFFILAGSLLNIKWSYISQFWHILYRFIRWFLSIFHLVTPAPKNDELQQRKPKIIKRKLPQAKLRTSWKHTNSKERKRTSNGKFELPDPSFLEKASFSKNIVTNDLKRNAAAMEIHFAEYGVRGKVVGIRPGPIVTLYEFMPESGVRMVDISKTVKDMTRAMATENIRIAHIPNTQLIGVEMVNLDRQIVRAQSLIDNPTFTNSKYKIPLALGVDIGGRPMFFDLVKMPHVLIAGRTGSGKSIFIQSIIMSILYRFTPDKCKLLIIDPKGVDFISWDGIPHLIAPVLTDATSAVNALKWSVREMDKRYKKLQLLGAQDINVYNEIVAKKRAAGEVMTKKVIVGTNLETGELEYEDKKIDLSDMPYLIIIIDEVADLMSVARKDIEACVQRLAQKARAAGIHLVAATQRPDTSIITGIIKSNFPTRISFQARSVIDSMTTLGEKGAEQLLSCGDMLFSEAGRTPVRIHGAFIESTEIARVANFLRNQGEPEYIDEILEDEDTDILSGGFSAFPSSKADKDADLYIQAKEYVIRDRKPTISYIQRRLGIGYNKAAGFMERMEAEGIVSPPDANNKRHIL